MTIHIDFDDTQLDESPCTIAYVLLAMCTTTFDCEVSVEWSLGEEYLTIRDEASGFEHFRLQVSPMMGRMLVSILEQTGEQISGSIDEW
jgi:hypothetical protein